MKKYRGELLVLLSALGFGTMGVLAGGLYRSDYPVISTLIFRFYIAAIGLFFLLVYKKQSFHLDRDQLGLTAFLGFVGYALFSLLYFQGIKWTGATVTAIVFATYPIFVALMAKVVFHRAIGLKKWLCLAGTLAGLFLLTAKGEVQINGAGVMCALGGAFLYGIYTMILEHPRLKPIPPLVCTFYIILFTAAALSLVGWAKGQYVFPQHPEQWLRLSALGVFATVIAIWSFYEGVLSLGAVKASILSNTEALISAVLAAIFLGERLTFLQWVGGGIMIVSIVILTVLQRERKVSIDIS